MKRGDRGFLPAWLAGGAAKGTADFGAHEGARPHKRPSFRDRRHAALSVRTAAAGGAARCDVWFSAEDGEL